MSNGVAHGDLTLFDCPRVRRYEYWQFIKLVAPADASALPAGQTHWLSQDASDAFCLKCQKMFRFLKGSSNSVRRHMERFHKKELLKHHAQTEVTAKKASSTGAAGNSNSSGSNGSGLKGKPLKKTNKRLHQEMLHQHDMSPSSGEKHGGGSGGGSGSSDFLAAASSGGNKMARSGSFGSFEQRNATELLVKWLCRNMRSLAIVDDPGFADFVEYISGGGGGNGSGANGFMLPNHEALSHRLELMAENARFELRQRVKKEVAHCALSADVWTRAGHERSGEWFVALSCHSLTEDFAMNTWTLDVIPLLGASSDSSDELTTRMHTLLRDWGLQKQMPTLLFSDGDERIEKTGLALSLRCFKDIGASLEQILSRGAGLFGSSSSAAASIEQQQDSQDRLGLLESESDELSPSHGAVLSSALAELKAFTDALSAYPAATDKLQTIHSAVGGDCLKIASYASDSWIDLFDFLSRAVLWQSSLDLFFDFVATPDGSKMFSGVTLVKPSSRMWYIAEALVLILQPFHELREVVAAEKRCSLPFIVPCLSVIKQQLGRDDLFTELTLRYRATTSYDGFDALNHLHALQHGVLNEFLRQYDTVCRELQWCSALDPRYGKLRHLSEDERELCKISLVERAMDLFVSQLPPAPPANEPPLGGLASDFDGDMMYGVGRAAPVQGLMHRLLYDDDEDVSSSEALSREAEIAQTRLYVANEVQMYASEHQLRKTRISCPLQWWQANRERYPFLSPLARIWLGTITSCSSSSSSAGSPSSLAAGLRHTIPEELCVDRKSDSASVSWQRTVADMIFLHTNLRSRSETSISL